MLFGVAVVVLWEIEKAIVFGMVEGVMVLRRLQVPDVPHLGGLHDGVAGLSRVRQGLEFASYGRFVGLGVDAEKHIGIGQ